MYLSAQGHCHGVSKRRRVLPLNVWSALASIGDNRRVRGGREGIFETIVLWLVFGLTLTGQDPFGKLRAGRESCDPGETVVLIVILLLILISLGVWL